MTNFFSKNELSGNELFEALRIASEGLNFVSEIDSPIEPFESRSTLIDTTTITVDAVAGSIGIRADSDAEVKDFAVFFDRLTAGKDWHTEVHKERIQRFLGIRKLLEENLRDLKVFRFGQVRVAIVIAGIDRDNRLMGLRTEAVET